MGKTLAGVKYGNLTSRKPPSNTKAQGKMSGRSGPPMVSIGKGGGQFVKTGSVSERNATGTNSGKTPSIGSQKGRSGRVGPY